MNRIQLGQKIKQLRLARNLTQPELGKRVGISYTQIQKYEYGSNDILASRLYDLAEALSIDVVDFFISAKQHETCDGKILELVKGYSKIKGKKFRDIVYLLVKSFAQC